MASPASAEVLAHRPRKRKNLNLGGEKMKIVICAAAACCLGLSVTRATPPSGLPGSLGGRPEMEMRLEVPALLPWQDALGRREVFLPEKGIPGASLAWSELLGTRHLIADGNFQALRSLVKGAALRQQSLRQRESLLRMAELTVAMLMLMLMAVICWQPKTPGFAGAA
jgi:hypothetical protein